MKTTRNIRIILIISLLAFFAYPKIILSQNYLDKIVIDAGHGGKDPGASGKYSREKDVVLKLALLTGQELKKLYPNLEIIYTRKTDVFIPLKERAEIANRANADLFISIHCNSNASSQPQGSETYVMGLHKSEANLNVAKKENAAILFEEDYKKNYDGFDPTSDESHIIFNFFQNSYLSQNLDLASKMQNKFSISTPLRDRGVKQAGFWVLYKTTMPGVLIETGFLSNPKDEKFLNSNEGQSKISKSIANAISDYKKEHDTRERLKAEQDQNLANNSSEEELTNEVSGNKDTEEAKKNLDLNKEKVKTQTSAERIAKVSSQTKDEDENSIKPNNPSQKAIYSVQFLSLSKDKKLTGGKFDQMPSIRSYLHEGMYRYISGETGLYEDGLKLQSQVRKLGFKDAFLVAFYQGKRISISEAKKINNEN